MTRLPADSDTRGPTLLFTPRQSERLADAVVHAVGVTLGIAGCVALAAMALPQADALVLTGLGVYATGLLAMLGCSAVYNMTETHAWKGTFRRLDHAAIFLMIAGTYTPFATIAIGGAWGTGLLVFVWLVAAGGMVLKMIAPDRLEGLCIAVYLLLGWSVLVVLDRLAVSISLPALILLATGGILYSVGVLFHLWTRLPYHRAIWHGFVLVAAACHYVAVLRDLVLVR